MTEAQYIAELVKKGRAAQAIYANFTQKQYNQAAQAAAKCIYDNAELLAREAVAETGMGTVEGKIEKMHGGMLNQWAYAKNRPSKGVIGWEKGKLDKNCILKIAKPIGIIAAVQPTTNPTTCMGGNVMQAMKTGNAIIICPHPRAKNVSLHCAELLREAIASVGAPKDLVQCIEEPSIAMTGEAMAQVDVVVATGGPGMVKAANSSGNPSLGVGQGNCQVMIDVGFEDWFDKISKNIIKNRIYDSGIPCTGEQTIIVPKKDREALFAAFEKNGAYVLRDPEYIEKLRHEIFMEKNGSYTSNPKAVGQKIQELGRRIGLTIPEDRLMMVVEINAYGKDELLCKEKMCPVTGIYGYEGGWEEAVKIGKTDLLMEGAGHSSDVYTHDKEHEMYAAMEIPVCRLPVNDGQNLVSGNPFYNGGFMATTGIGCGYWQKNILNRNLTFEDLLNITHVLYHVEDDQHRPLPTYEEVFAPIE